MKFKKFVKSLGADGILYVRENGDRWLSSGSIFMKVPEDIRTVTACDSASMLSLSLWKCSLTRRFPHWLSRDL